MLKVTLLLTLLQLDMVMVAAATAAEATGQGCNDLLPGHLNNSSTAWEFSYNCDIQKLSRDMAFHVGNDYGIVCHYGAEDNFFSSLTVNFSTQNVGPSDQLHIIIPVYSSFKSSTVSSWCLQFKPPVDSSSDPVLGQCLNPVTVLRNGTNEFMLKLDKLQSDQRLLCLQKFETCTLEFSIQQSDIIQGNITVGIIQLCLDAGHGSQEKDHMLEIVLSLTGVMILIILLAMFIYWMKNYRAGRASYEWL